MKSTVILECRFMKTFILHGNVVPSGQTKYEIEM